MTAQPKHNHMYDDWEVRLRMVENAIISIEKRFDKIDTEFKSVYREMRTNFICLVGIILASNSFLPMILHHFHLI